MDRVLESLGWMGCYQRVQFLLLMMPVVDIAIQIMSFIFLGRIFQHKCAEIDIPNVHLGNRKWIYENTTEAVNSSLPVTYGKCSVSVTNHSEEIFSSKCVNGYNYSEPWDRSFVSEWDLVCEKGALPEVSQTVMAIGMTLGSFFMTALADKYGRKPIYVANHVLYFCVSVATAFAPTYTSLLGLRFVHGIFQQGMGLVIAIMLVELLPTEKRALPSQVRSVVWPSGLLFMGLICYLCREMSWRHTQLVLAAFSCYSLLQWWLVEESLRWLDVQGKTEQAEHIMKLAAKRNGVDPSTVIRTYKEDTQRLLKSSHPLTSFPVDGNAEITDKRPGENLKDKTTLDTPTQGNGVKDEPKSHTQELSISTFFKNRSILLRMAISCYMWFVDSIAYYGLIMTSSSLADDIYLGFALNVLVELPASAALFLLINRIGRRRCMIVSHLIGGFSLVTAVLLSNTTAAAGIPGLQSIILVVSLLGKFGMSLGFFTLFVFTPELFPTTIRSTGFGLSSMSARFGGMIAPHFRTLQRHLPWLPGTIFAALALVVPVLVKLLPETQGQELPQTVSDMGRARPVPQQGTPIVKGLSTKKEEDKNQI